MFQNCHIILGSRIGSLMSPQQSHEFLFEMNGLSMELIFVPIIPIPGRV